MEICLHGGLFRRLPRKTGLFLLQSILEAGKFEEIYKRVKFSSRRFKTRLQIGRLCYQHLPCYIWRKTFKVDFLFQRQRLQFRTFSIGEEENYQIRKGAGIWL